MTQSAWDDGVPIDELPIYTTPVATDNVVVLKDPLGTPEVVLSSLNHLRKKQSIIEPDQLVADTHDWAPTDGDTKDIWLVDTDASRQITGIGFPETGRIITLINDGTNPIVFTDEDSNSDEINRFSLQDDKAVTLHPNEAITFWYSNASRWFQLSRSANRIEESLVVAASDEVTALTTGAAKITFRMPYAFKLTSIRCHVTTAPTDAALIVDVNQDGISILSTKLTIDASEKTSSTAAIPPVMSTTDLTDDAEITIDIDQVGSTIAGAGLKVALLGYKV